MSKMAKQRERERGRQTKTERDRQTDTERFILNNKRFNTCLKHSNHSDWNWGVKQGHMSNSNEKKWKNCVLSDRNLPENSKWN